MTGGTVVHVRPSVAESLEAVAALTPLMISLDHLLAVPYDSALGEERFTVEVRRGQKSAQPYPEDGPSVFTSIELTAGEIALGALVPEDVAWSHVMIHRALPRRHPFEDEFTPALERAFLAALRDAVRSLRPPVAGAL